MADLFVRVIIQIFILAGISVNPSVAAVNGITGKNGAFIGVIMRNDPVEEYQQPGGQKR